MFRFGILGASYFATHKMIPAMQAAGDTPVVAIASRDGTKAAEAARALGIPKTYDSYDALLADPDVDGVYVPLPNHLHVAWAEKAAAAGKHVLVEKPVALGAAEARRLLAARDAHNVLICEAAMVRLHPRWLAVRELVRKGKIGELGAFVGTFGYDLSARRDNVRFDPGMGGGVLLDVGFYPVTMSRFCFDDEPTEVVAHMERDTAAGVDVMTSAVLRFARGHAVFTCGMQLAPAARAASGQQGAHRRGARVEPDPRPPVGARAGDQRPAGSLRGRTRRVPGGEPVHHPGAAVRARRGGGRSRPDSARRFHQEHGRARCAAPLGRQPALGTCVATRLPGTP